MRSLKKYSPENRAIDDFLKIFNFSQRNKQKFAIISIDVQRGMFKFIFKKDKVVPRFIEYSKRNQDLSKKNDIPFFDVRMDIKEFEESIFVKDNLNDKTNINLIEKKYKSTVIGTNLLEKLNELDIKNIYVIGLFRNRCVLATITDLIKENKFNIITSFYGTNNFFNDDENIKSSKSAIEKYKEKNIIDYQNEKPTEFESIHQQMGDKKYKFSNEIKFLKQNNVLILDYFYKNSNGKIVSDLEEFGRK